LDREKNYASQLLNIHRISDVRQIEIHVIPLEVEISVVKLKRYNSPGTGQILAKLI
jgi:hypothetical protein